MFPASYTAQIGVDLARGRRYELSGARAHAQVAHFFDLRVAILSTPRANFTRRHDLLNRLRLCCTLGEWTKLSSLSLGWVIVGSGSGCFRHLRGEASVGI